VAPATSAAARRVVIENPTTIQALDSDSVPFQARASRGARVVTFWVDGRRRFIDRSAPWRFGSNGRLSLRRLANGEHRLKVRAWWRVRSRWVVRTAYKRVTIRRKVTPDSTPPPDPTPSTDTSNAGSDWGSAFEGSGFGEWSWWGQGDSSYTGLSTVDPADRGIPRLNGRSGRFQVTDSDAAAGRIHSKLYKYFHSGSGDRVNWRPTNVSGSYRAWYYLPTDYSVRPGKWVTPFQFKDQYWYTQRGGSEHSDPTWYLAFKNASDYGVSASRPDAPVAIVQHWKDWERGYRDYIYPGQRVPVPLGRWFEIRAEVYQGDRVEFYMDGKLVNVGRHSDYPVGNHHSLSFNWIFGIGNYTNSPSWLLADQAALRRR